VSSLLDTSELWCLSFTGSILCFCEGYGRPGLVDSGEEVAQPVWGDGILTWDVVIGRVEQYGVTKESVEEGNSSKTPNVCRKMRKRLKSSGT
jgi:hypothetical protein